MTKLDATLYAMQDGLRAMRSLVDRARQLRQEPATNEQAGRALDAAVDSIADALSEMDASLNDALEAATQLTNRPRPSAPGA